MDGARLLLFTDSYPFGTAEGFIAAELPFLVDAFGSVVVLPHLVSGTPRDLPPGVSLDLSLSAESIPQSARLRVLYAALTSPLLYREVARRGLPRSFAVLRHLVGCGATCATTRRWARTALPAWGDRPLICYTYWLGPTTLGLALERGSQARLLLVSRAHGFDLYDSRSRGLLRPETIAATDLPAFISNHGLEYARGRWGAAVDRGEVMRLGTRDPGFRTAASRDGTLRVVSCSFIVAVKRLPLLVAALAELGARNSGRTVRWDHLGDGPGRADLERHAARLPPNVQWKLHGQLETADVVEFYRTNPADVFVNVSSSEGVSVAMMEAMSCGIPVVATAVGGTPEIVGGDNGVLLPANPAAAAVADAVDAVFAAGDGGQRRHAARRTWAELCDATRNYVAFAARLRALAQ
jgi:colanic acid/amylovoran biosynthesis glycosyltransferase